MILILIVNSNYNIIYIIKLIVILVCEIILVMLTVNGSDNGNYATVCPFFQKEIDVSDNITIT